MSIIFSIGRWGGIYFHWGYSKRICLGWAALTFIPQDIDDVIAPPAKSAPLTQSDYEWADAMIEARKLMENAEAGDNA